jgi:hypothetical protein
MFVCGSDILGVAMILQSSQGESAKVKNDGKSNHLPQSLFEQAFTLQVCVVVNDGTRTDRFG